jgi:zinc transport system substrate-binding protein
MLHKNTLLFAALSAALWGTTAQDVNAAVVASLKPLGFIASAIADGVTETQVCCLMVPLSMIIPCALQM